MVSLACARAHDPQLLAVLARLQAAAFPRPKPAAGAWMGRMHALTAAGAGLAGVGSASDEDEDLNVVSADELRARKQRMDVAFEQHRITHDDPRFEYNVQKDFAPVRARHCSTHADCAGGGRRRVGRRGELGRMVATDCSGPAGTAAPCPCCWSAHRERSRGDARTDNGHVRAVVRKGKAVHLLQLAGCVR